MLTTNKSERVIVKELATGQEFEATMHYEVEGNDLELRLGENPLETGSWPLQFHNIISYLDRECAPL